MGPTRFIVHCDQYDNDTLVDWHHHGGCPVELADHLNLANKKENASGRSRDTCLVDTAAMCHPSIMAVVPTRSEKKWAETKARDRENDDQRLLPRNPGLATTFRTPCDQSLEDF
jgi:hypothetical protein